MKQERIIYFVDLFRFFHKNWRRFFRLGVGCFLLTGFWLLLFSEPHFCAEASFQQAPNKTENSASLQSLLKNMQNSSTEFSAVSIMFSKKILGKVIEERGLQIKEAKNALFSRLGRFFLQEKEAFLFQQVHFEKETPKKFFLKVVSKEDFEILNEKKQLLTKGRVKETVQLEEFSFTVMEMPGKKNWAAFTLLPKRDLLRELTKRITIKSARDDRNILKMKCRHPQRKIAIGILDSLMKEFQGYLRDTQKELAAEQIIYLKQRQTELSSDLDQILEEYASYLQKGEGSGIGLSQEIQTLADPHERYSASLHQLELESKSWKKEIFQAKADHPWKEGWEKKEALEWEEKHLPAQPGVIAEEFAGMDLKTLQQLHIEYSRERDAIFTSLSHLEAFKNKIQEPQFEITALSQILTDNVSQTIIQEGARLSLQMNDQANRSQKELKYIKEALEKQKGFLREHLIQKMEILQLKCNLIEEKMIALNQTVVALIQKEKGYVGSKLDELHKKMQQLPHRWLSESQLKLKKELTLQMIEGLTMLIESKALDHHLFHVESKPLDVADAPLHIEPPHLLLFSSMGGILGAFFFFMMSLIKTAFRGFPISKEYLLDNKYQFLGDSKQNYREILYRISLAVQPNEVIALLGGDYASDLAPILVKTGMRVLRIEIGSDQNPSSPTDPDLIFLETLLHKSLPSKLASWKSIYDCILIQSRAKLDSAEAIACISLADRFILALNEETEEVLAPFHPEKTLCVLNS